MASKIKCPKELGIKWLKNVNHIDYNISALEDENKDISLFVDMTDVKFCYPAGLCGLHEIIRSQTGTVKIKRPENNDAFQYLQRIGFFNNLKIFPDKCFNSHDASGRFKEMMVISKDIQPRSSVVDNLCRDIACVVAPNDRDFQDFILFCMGEMVNNVIQHSHSKGITCAQFYPKTKEVEVAIADHGRGIKAGLKDNPNFHYLDSDLETLELSTRPDTSGTFFCGTEPYSNNVNSGNGLYFLKKIIEKSYGHLNIFSHAGHFYQDGAKQPDIRDNSFFPGTLVVFRLNRDYTSTLQDVLREIREETQAAKKLADSLPDIQFE